MTARYDPFVAGPLPVGVRTVAAHDPGRDRTLPCEVWYPAAGVDAGGEPVRDADAAPGPHPLIVVSHSSGGDRHAERFLCTHLAGHGYAVAAADHSEIVAPELARRDDEAPDQRAARVAAVIAARVPDVRLVLDHLLQGGAGVSVDPARIGLVGHSFGGWTVLAVPEVDARVRSVVAMGPGGSSRPMPGILAVKLTFTWAREVSTLYLAAEDDVLIPLRGVRELFERTPRPRRMAVLRRADHQHFVDDVEGDHEGLRTATLHGDAAWIPAAMRPIGELCGAEQAHDFVRGLTLSHFDLTLRGSRDAELFLESDVDAALRARGVDALTVRD